MMLFCCLCPRELAVPRVSRFQSHAAGCYFPLILMQAVSSWVRKQITNDIWRCCGSTFSQLLCSMLVNVVQHAHNISRYHSVLLQSCICVVMIADVINPDQARVAEDSGAVAVMALERVPSDIRASGGVARMSDPDMILGIKKCVTIPVMAKARIGHFVEAQILEALDVDYIDESEVLTMADEETHINKSKFRVPFVCGCRDLGEGLRRIAEGAAMLRTKGEAGTGNVVEAVRHARAVNRQIRHVVTMDEDELFAYAKSIQAPMELLREVRRLERLPVVNFAAGGIATPADAALMMQLGVDGVFVGSGIFKSGEPEKRGKAIVAAVTHFNNPKILAEVSRGLGEAMSGVGTIAASQVAFRERGM